MIDFGGCSATDAADQGDAGLVGPSYQVAVTGPVGEIAEVRSTGSTAVSRGTRRTGSTSRARHAAAGTR